MEKDYEVTLLFFRNRTARLTAWGTGPKNALEGLMICNGAGPRSQILIDEVPLEKVDVKKLNKNTCFAKVSLQNGKKTSEKYYHVETRTILLNGDDNWQSLI